MSLMCRRICAHSAAMPPESEYPGRLRHAVPDWVKAGALFHIRLRVAPEQTPPPTESPPSDERLAAALRYHETERWWGRLIVLMPDHLHALLSFPQTEGLSTTLRDWKRATTRFHGVRWQVNFFDHHLRSEAEADEASDVFRPKSGGEGFGCASGRLALALEPHGVAARRISAASSSLSTGRGSRRVSALGTMRSTLLERPSPVILAGIKKFPCPCQPATLFSSPPSLWWDIQVAKGR